MSECLSVIRLYVFIILEFIFREDKLIKKDPTSIWQFDPSL